MRLYQICKMILFLSTSFKALSKSPSTSRKKNWKIFGEIEPALYEYTKTSISIRLFTGAPNFT